MTPYPTGFLQAPELFAGMAQISRDQARIAEEKAMQVRNELQAREIAIRDRQIAENAANQRAELAQRAAEVAARNNLAQQQLMAEAQQAQQANALKEQQFQLAANQDQERLAFEKDKFVLDKDKFGLAKQGAESEEADRKKKAAIETRAMIAQQKLQESLAAGVPFDKAIIPLIGDLTAGSPSSLVSIGNTFLRSETSKGLAEDKSKGVLDKAANDTEAKKNLATYNALLEIIKKDSDLDRDEKTAAMDALNKRFKIGKPTTPKTTNPGMVRVQSPDGTTGFIPSSRVDDAVKNGGYKVIE